MEKRLKALSLGFFIGLTLVNQPIFSRGNNLNKQRTEPPISTYININNLAMWIRSDGYSSNNPFSRESTSAIQWGILYPKNTSTGLVWADGFVWGGFVNDGQSPALRVGGTNWWDSGLQTGALETSKPESNRALANHIWRYRPDWQTADLTNEAFTLLASMPNATELNFEFPAELLQTVTDSIRLSYEHDLQTWPWQLGAPFYDDNKNGQMDEGEMPGLLEADQVVWLVANDLHSGLTKALFGAPPIGIELQMTLWAYKGDPDLETTVFRRNRLIYKGRSTTPAKAFIDSMAFSIYSEIDIGTVVDDLGGTDTTLQMVFGYNSITNDALFPNIISVPAIGYHVLQGPIIPGETSGDTAVFNFRELKGKRNVGMTGSVINKAGDQIPNPASGSYNGTLMYYNSMNGFRRLPITPPTPYINPDNGQITRFLFPGDPVANLGWLDMYGSNLQTDLAIANFTMALGDTQEVIYAITAGLGSDRLSSVQVMKFFARKVQEFSKKGYLGARGENNETKEVVPENLHLHQNFPNPFNPNTQISLEVPAELYVNLSVYNVLGQKITTLLDEFIKAGSYTLGWDGTNQLGHDVAGGIYFYQMNIGRFSETKKMLLIR